MKTFTIRKIEEVHSTTEVQAKNIDEAIMIVAQTEGDDERWRFENEFIDFKDAKKTFTKTLKED